VGRRGAEGPEGGVEMDAGYGRIGHDEDAAALEPDDGGKEREGALPYVDLVRRVEADPYDSHVTSARAVRVGQL